jgi:hypothetical protein
MVVVVPTTAVPVAVADSMVATKVEADSTLAAEDIPSGKSFRSVSRSTTDGWRLV